MTYDEYVDLNGKLDEAEFTELLPFVVNTIDGYIASVIPKWKVEDYLDDYQLPNINFILMLQIDFIASSGGINALIGKSDFNVKSVVTSGITMQLSDSTLIKYQDGVPISPMVESTFIKELRKKGYLELGIW